MEGGEICLKSVAVQYKLPETGNKYVFINLKKITKGKEIYMQRLSQSEKDKLGEHNIIRIEKHEIGWFLSNSKEFDLIMTQEAEYEGSRFSYDKTATGQNPVTQYFINKYPPLK